MKYYIACAISFILTPFAVSAAYNQRGYFAIGGEYLILPLMILVMNLFDSIVSDVKQNLK